MSWFARLFRSVSQGDLVQIVSREWKVIRVPTVPDNESRVKTTDSRFTVSISRPIPLDATVLVPGQIQRGSRSDNSVFYKLILSGWIGKHVKFTFMSDRAGYIAIWGPNPLQIGPPWGRMRMPAVGQADVLIGTCEGNFVPGTYYIEVAATGTVGPIGPVGDYSILTTLSFWKWW